MIQCIFHSCCLLLAMASNIGDGCTQCDEWHDSYDFEKDGVYYVINGDDACVCYESSILLAPFDYYDYRSSYKGDVTVPDSVCWNERYYKVRQVMHNAFYNCDSLHSLTLPPGIRTIGGKAFQNCTGLARVTLPDSLDEIASDLFNGCKKLDKIEIPDGVRKIGKYSFNGCSSLASIQIPESVNSIGDYAFSFCESLEEIEIPQTVSQLGDFFMYGCNSLKRIVIPANVELNEWKTLALHLRDYRTYLPVIYVSECDTMQLEYFEHTNHIIVTPDRRSVYHDGLDAPSLAPLEISEMSEAFKVEYLDGVDTIPDFHYADSHLKGMKSLVLPSSIKYIGKSAFYDSGQLENIIINGKPDIGMYAFAKSSGINDISVESPEPPVVCSYADGKPETVFVVEAEDGANTASVNMQDSVISADEASSGQALAISAMNSLSDKWEVRFDIHYQIGGWYDVYAVILPGAMGYGNPDNLQNKFQAKIEYMDKDGVASVWQQLNAKGRQQDLYNNAKSIDTFLIGRIYARDMNPDGQDNVISVYLNSHLIVNEKYKYSNTMLLDCLYMQLVSVTDPSTVDNPQTDLEPVANPFLLDDNAIQKYSSSVFDEAVYANSILHVPDGADGKYQSAPCWKSFYNYGGATTSVIGDMHLPDNSCEYFSIDGKALTEPKQGLNIARLPDGTYVKFFKR